MALVNEFGIPNRGAGCKLLRRGVKRHCFAEASTVKIKLYNYYYCNYVIVVYFSYVIFISILITVSNTHWSIKVVLPNVFVFYHVSRKGG